MAGDMTYSITDGQIGLLYKCNQEKDNTCMMLHASLENNDVVVVSRYNALIILILAYTKYNQKKRYLKYDHNTLADIDSICKFLGTKISCSSGGAYYDRLRHNIIPV